MNMYFTLLKAQLNNRFGFTAFKSNFKYNKKAFRKQLGMFAVVLLSMVYLIGFYSFLLYKLFEVTKEAGMQEIILVGTILASMVMILFLGLMFILGFLFFAKDSQFLATLPAKPSTVFATKFTQVYLNEFVVSLAFLVPAVVIYGSGMGMGVLYYIKAVLVIIFVPAIPLLISALLSMVLMGFVSKTRRRDAVLVVGSILLLVLIVVGENLLISQIPENGDTQYLLAVLSSQTGLINFLGRGFPPSAWATLALVKENMSGLTSLLGFIGLSGGLIALTMPIAGKIYYNGALSHLETAKKNRKSKTSLGKSSPTKAIFFREWRTILRSPIYAMNSLAGIFMGLIIMLMPLFGGMNDPDLQFFMDLITSEYSLIVLLGLAGLMVLVGSVNPAAATTISREGSAYWISKIIPVDYKKQISAKFWFGYSIAGICAVTVAIGSLIGFNLSVPIVLGSLAVSLLALISLTAISVIIDLMRPKFDWSSETEAIKQNMNVVGAMLIGAVIVVAYGGLTWLMFKVGIADNIILIVDLLIAAVTAILAYRYMLNLAEKRYSSIE